jgi:uncharacterized protein YcnI
MSRSFVAAALAAAVLGATAPAALAHVTLESSEAPASSFYKAVLRVGHGCDGSPTVAIRVQIPDGFLQAKPMPKPDWKLETVVKKLDQPYDWYGTMITEDVREIVWSGGNLPDAFYDEFVFRAKLPDKVGETIYIPVIQECESGVHRWIEIPAAGKSADDYEEPAPGLTLTPAKDEH